MRLRTPLSMCVVVCAVNQGHPGVIAKPFKQDLLCWVAWQHEAVETRHGCGQPTVSSTKEAHRFFFFKKKNTPPQQH